MHQHRRHIAFVGAVLLHALVLLLSLRQPKLQSEMAGDAQGTVASFELIQRLPERVTKPPSTAAPIVSEALVVAPAAPATDESTSAAPAEAAAASGVCRPSGSPIETLIKLALPAGVEVVLDEAFVDLSFHLDDLGHAMPEGITIERSSGITALDEAAIRHAVTYAFALPGCENTGALESVTVRIRFDATTPALVVP